MAEREPAGSIQAPDLTMRGSCYANTAKRFSPVQSVFRSAARRRICEGRINLNAAAVS